MGSAQRFGRVLPGPTRLARARCTCQTPHTFADDGRALEGQTECIAVFLLLLVCAVIVRVVAVQPAIVGHPIHHALLVTPHLVELIDWVVLESSHNVVGELVLFPQRHHRCNVSHAARLLGLAAQCAKERQVADIEVGIAARYERATAASPKRLAQSRPAPPRCSRHRSRWLHTRRPVVSTTATSLRFATTRASTP